MHDHIHGIGRGLVSTKHDQLDQAATAFLLLRSDPRVLDLYLYFYLYLYLAGRQEAFRPRCRMRSKSICYTYSF